MSFVRRIEEDILLLKIRHGDQAAYATIYDRYVDALFRYISWRVRSTEQAEDLTSELFLKVWQYLTDGDKAKVQNIRAFLYQSARNLIADHYRTMQEELPLDEAINVTLDKQPRHLSVEQRLTLSEVEQGLAKLKGEWQEIIILAHVEGMKPGEIAPIIGKSAATTRVMLHRALQELKKILNQGNL